jgi:hypothetical protein
MMRSDEKMRRKGELSRLEEEPRGRAERKV